jgi:hypothetical protein
VPCIYKRDHGLTNHVPAYILRESLNHGRWFDKWSGGLVYYTDV